MRTIDNRVGEIPALFLCVTAWVGLCILALLIFNKLAYLPSFLLGVAGSALYVYILYRRVTITLVAPSVLDAAPEQSGKRNRFRWDWVKNIRSGWIKSMQPIMGAVLIILVISHLAQISFLAAIFGFFSFQISIFLYMAVVSLFQFLKVR